MLSKLRNWLAGGGTVEDRPLHTQARGTPQNPARDTATRRIPAGAAVEDRVPSEVASAGAHKNTPVRRRFVREDSGTHETLKIIDDSMFGVEEVEGIDPYNTGQFDKSKSWNRRFSK
jgi:hypothetical protein